MTEDTPRRISARRLADLADTSLEHVETLARAALLTPDDDGRYSPGDVHAIRVIDAFVAAGVPVAVLARANERGAISLAYYDQLHPSPGPRSARTYGQLKRDLGDRAELLGRLVAALGMAEPDPTSRLPREDESLLLRVLDIVESTQVPDLALRAARLFGDGTRRTTEAVLTVYGEAVERVVGQVAGIPSREVNDRFFGPWNRFARLAPDLGRWLTARHLTNAIDAWSVNATEQFLAVSGFVAPRSQAPPAIAFVDLAGFTRLAEQGGDERAATTALEFARLAERVANEHAGRVVKLLGDGALLHFEAATDAVDASLALIAALPGAGLPPGHAGVAVGPVITRDGDVFGRTVNLASRIADVADAGSTLIPAAGADLLPPDRYRLEPARTVTLQGLAEPTQLVRVSSLSS